MPDYLITDQGRRLAYYQTPGAAPGVVFLGGFQSDMSGTKATWLQGWAQARGRAFLRFDYSGHGQSSGAFTDGCIGDWAADAAQAVTRLTSGSQVLVGSSMGGWIALLLARQMPARIHALLGIAAAPDFTEDSLWPALDTAQRAALERDGATQIHNPYDETPTPLTRKLFEDGRRNLVLRTPLALPFPVRLLQGTRDAEVPTDVALRLLEHADCPDMRLTLVKGADHRFSGPDALALTGTTLAALVAGDFGASP